jgi:hypothetical protein
MEFSVSKNDLNIQLRFSINYNHLYYKIRKNDYICKIIY